MITREDIINELISDGDDNFTEEQFNQMAAVDLFEEYLQWNGLINWTGTIIEVYNALFQDPAHLKELLEVALAIICKADKDNGNNQYLETYYAYNESHFGGSEADAELDYAHIDELSKTIEVPNIEE